MLRRRRAGGSNSRYRFGISANIEDQGFDLLVKPNAQIWINTTVILDSVGEFRIGIRMEEAIHF